MGALDITAIWFLVNERLLLPLKPRGDCGCVGLNGRHLHPTKRVVKVGTLVNTVSRPLKSLSPNDID